MKKAYAILEKNRGIGELCAANGYSVKKVIGKNKMLGKNIYRKLKEELGIEEYLFKIDRYKNYNLYEINMIEKTSILMKVVSFFKTPKEGILIIE